MRPWTSCDAPELQGRSHAHAHAHTRVESRPPPPPPAARRPRAAPCPPSVPHAVRARARVPAASQFGLSPDSVERVLVSSPPMVSFKYKVSAQQPAGSPEAATLEVLRQPKDWLAATP